MRKLSQTEELVKILAGRARRHTLTPEQISRALDEQEYDVSGLDALYAALEARGIRVTEEEADMPMLDETQIGELEHELSAEGVALDDPVKAYLKEIGRVPLLTMEQELALARAAQAGDADARRKLSEANLRLVVSVLGLYVSNESVTQFQPMNINFGIMPPLDHRVKGKRNKNAELSQRSLAIIEQLKQEVLNYEDHH